MTLANRYSHTDVRTLIEEGIEEYWSDVEEEEYDAESLEEYKDDLADEIRAELEALNSERKDVFAVVADTNIRYGVSTSVCGIYESERVAKRACDLLNELERLDRLDGWEDPTEYRVQPMTLNCNETQLSVWYME